jgi:hypothetical protein
MPHICNVRVNAICPYWVETDILASVSSEGADKDPQAKMTRNSPRTALSTVVEGFLTFAADENRNSKLPYIIFQCILCTFFFSLSIILLSILHSSCCCCYHQVGLYQIFLQLLLLILNSRIPQALPSCTCID